jgi:hypothetical protein
MKMPGPHGAVPKSILALSHSGLISRRGEQEWIELSGSNPGVAHNATQPLTNWGHLYCIGLPVSSVTSDPSAYCAPGLRDHSCHETAPPAPGWLWRVPPQFTADF